MRVHDLHLRAAVQNTCVRNIVGDQRKTCVISLRSMRQREKLTSRTAGSTKEIQMKRSKSADPAHDVLGYERQQLDAIFRPETVAVIGASERPGTARPAAQPPRTPSGSRTIPIPTALSACRVASRAQPTACNRRNPVRSPPARTGSRLHTASNRPGSRGGTRRRKPRLLGRPTTTLKGPRPNSSLSSYDPVV